MLFIVFDLDDTLINRDCHAKPYSHLILTSLFHLKNVKLILWSYADISHVKKCLVDNDMERYFHKIYCRPTCEKSLEKFGFPKDARFIKTMNVTTIIGIDDKYKENFNGYTYVVPFDKPDEKTALVDALNSIMQYIGFYK